MKNANIVLGYFAADHLIGMIKNGLADEGLSERTKAQLQPLLDALGKDTADCITITIDDNDLYD